MQKRLCIEKNDELLRITRVPIARIAKRTGTRARARRLSSRGITRTNGEPPSWVGLEVRRGGHRWSLAERQQMLGQVSHALAADLLHDLTKLALEHDQCVITAPGSQGAHAIHEAAAHEDKLGP